MSWLLVDWNLITRQSKLLKVPAKVTVEDIVNNYIIHMKLPELLPHRKLAITHYTMGWKVTFDNVFRRKLLYKFERPQYADILQQQQQRNMPMSKVYGPLHLLRLFVLYGSMLDAPTLKERDVVPLRTHLQEFLKYMAENSAALFSLQDYENSSPKYQQKAAEDDQD